MANIDIPQNMGSDITQQALNVASDASGQINDILQDISGDNKLGFDSNSTLATAGNNVLTAYGYNATTTGVDITQASGAMVIDDLMQKISTKVQVAAQLLSTENNIAKTVSRELQK